MILSGIFAINLDATDTRWTTSIYHVKFAFRTNFRNVHINNQQANTFDL